VDVIVDVPTSSIALAINQISAKKAGRSSSPVRATSELTGKACSRTPPLDLRHLDARQRTGNAIVKPPATPVFITADYAFGLGAQREPSPGGAERTAASASQVRPSLNAQDFSSSCSGAGFQARSWPANAGGDTTNAIKQAAESGSSRADRARRMLVFISDIHGWAWTRRRTDFHRDLLLGLEYRPAPSPNVSPRNSGKYPTMVQGGRVSTLMHYLKAVEPAKPMTAQK